MTTITVRDMATIKRVAQSVAPYTVKKAKLQKKMVEIAEEIKQCDASMESFQAAIRSLTGGRSTEQVLVRTTVNGSARYEPNTEVVRYNDTTKLYEFIEDEQHQEAEQPAAVVEEPEAEAPATEQPAEEAVTEQEEEAIQAATEQAAEAMPENLPFDNDPFAN